MTEAEVLEIINFHIANAMNAFAIYLSLTFAFLTAIYIVGTKLNKKQVVLVVTLYLGWSTAFALVAITHIQAMDSLVRENAGYIRSQLFHLPWNEFAIIVTAAGILICGIFVFDIRKGLTSLDESSEE